MADIAEIEDGWVRTSDTPSGSFVLCFVHEGMRIERLRHPDGRSVVLGILGGMSAAAGFEEEGIQTRMTPRALRRAAAELLLIADECERVRA